MKGSGLVSDIGSLFASNHGKGPLMARLVRVVSGVAYMERWSRWAGRRKAFRLPVAFLSSPACGWRLQKVTR